MNNNTDVIIIGAGHNGLVCAYYLAASGLSVKVLERRGVVGGAAVTEEFHPGFKNSVASYTVSLLNPKVIRDMELARHGRVTATGACREPECWANAFLIANGDRFFLFNEKGELVIAKLTPKGYEEIDRAHLLDPSSKGTSTGFRRDVLWSHPAFANRCVYVRNDEELICVSLAK